MSFQKVKDFVAGDGRQNISGVVLEQNVVGSKEDGFFPITGAGSLAFRADVLVGDIAVTGGITLKMQHRSSRDMPWVDAKSVSVTASGFDFVDGDVSVVNDTITEASHGLVTGQKVALSSSGDLPTGLTAGDYYVIYVDANTFKLATSRDNANKGVAVDITAATSGDTHSVKAQVLHSFKYLVQVAGDQTHLPLRQQGRFVVTTTDAADACNVDAVFVAQEVD